jgi:hypothetical protein
MWREKCNGVRGELFITPTEREGDLGGWGGGGGGGGGEDVDYCCKSLGITYFRKK